MSRRPLEPAVLQKMPHLLGCLAPPQQRRMQSRQNDVIAFAAEARARLKHEKVGLGGDDSQLGHFGRRQRANEAGVFIGQLHERWAETAQVGREAAGDV